MIEYKAEPFARPVISGNVDAEAGVVDISVDATRKLSIESEIIEGGGKKNRIVWSQQLSFSNKQKFSEGGFVMVRALYKLKVLDSQKFEQEVKQTTAGRLTSTHNGVPTIIDNFNYPLDLKFTVSNGGSGRK